MLVSGNSPASNLTQEHLWISLHISCAVFCHEVWNSPSGSWKCFLRMKGNLWLQFIVFYWMNFCWQIQMLTYSFTNCCIKRCNCIVYHIVANFRFPRRSRLLNCLLLATRWGKIIWDVVKYDGLSVTHKHIVSEVASKHSSLSRQR